ncbi:dihydrolipoyl dehydrogenase [Luteibacter aegosomatissinici]|uniref:dihydrolipoyl dehydrogenase n=1 Tax=Luteibacter aegosomatissinici TaxID=2911539 RepID=UPI001FF7B9D8|nr:dihydrolipoyl dehydrogenase [Luteibacter aegosomatissinici]UPG92855.1 dihydrolipoyl dehydrogenase [Luteibacter aegosomatissinici]
MSQYDVLVIGGGPAGYNATIRAGQLGLKVACIEGAPVLGGTCLNVGCIPSKALLHASELFEMARDDFARLGIRVSPELDLARMMAQKDESVAALGKGVEYLYRKNKAEWIKGWASIAAPGEVDVRKDDGSTERLTARDIVIATGSVPASLPFLPVDGVQVVDSTGALALSSVPRHLVVIGGGVIGVEIGSVWRRLGASVTVVELMDHICPEADQEAARALQRALAKQGMAFRLGAKVTGATVSPGNVALSVESADGAALIEADVVLVAVGRVPSTRGLGLERVGITPDRRGTILHDHHQTGVPGIWVIGDVTTGPMLAHKAEEEAIACIERIAGRAGHVNYGVIPSVVYTRPELASVGQTEEQLKAAGRRYTVGKFAFQANSRAKVNHEAEGFVKVLADTDTDRILGVHMVGPGVSELIGEYCVAMEFRASSEDVARTCHPHPTRSEASRQAAMNVDGWAMQS